MGMWKSEPGRCIEMTTNNNSDVENAAHTYSLMAQMPATRFGIEVSFKAGYASRDAEVEQLREKIRLLTLYECPCNICEQHRVEMYESLRKSATKWDV